MKIFHLFSLGGFFNSISTLLDGITNIRMNFISYLAKITDPFSSFTENIWNFLENGTNSLRMLLSSKLLFSEVRLGGCEGTHYSCQYQKCLHLMLFEEMGMVYVDSKYNIISCRSESSNL